MMKRFVKRVLSVIPSRRGAERTPVDSSAINEITYDRDRLSLTVSFQGDRLYEYGSVEPERVRELLGAESVGRYFVREVRDRYPVRRVSSLA